MLRSSLRTRLSYSRYPDFQSVSCSQDAARSWVPTSSGKANASRLISKFTSKSHRGKSMSGSIISFSIRPGRISAGSWEVTVEMCCTIAAGGIKIGSIRKIGDSTRKNLPSRHPCHTITSMHFGTPELLISFVAALLLFSDRIIRRFSGRTLQDALGTRTLTFERSTDVFRRTRYCCRLAHDIPFSEPQIVPVSWKPLSSI